MKAILVVASLAALLFAGCTSEVTYTTPDMVNGEYIIKVGLNGQNTFTPRFAEVPEGAIVRFVNSNPSHNIVSAGNFGTSGAGYGADLVVDTATLGMGDFDFVCEPHVSLGMTGTLRVSAAA